MCLIFLSQCLRVKCNLTTPLPSWSHCRNSEGVKKSIYCNPLSRTTVWLSRWTPEATRVPILVNLVDAMQSNIGTWSPRSMAEWSDLDLYIEKKGKEKQKKMEGERVWPGLDIRYTLSLPLFSPFFHFPFNLWPAFSFLSFRGLDRWRCVFQRTRFRRVGRVGLGILKKISTWFQRLLRKMVSSALRHSCSFLMIGDVQDRIQIVPNRDHSAASLSEKNAHARKKKGGSWYWAPSLSQGCFLAWEEIINPENV